MSQVTLEISFMPVDTLYFKGSRPHAAAGASALQSEFPPPVSTVVGAVRTRLGDALEVDWKNLKAARDHEGLDIAKLIGTANDTGLLDFAAPYIVKQGVRLYPVPAVLLRNEQHLIRLKPGRPVVCDLGRVQLPELPEGVVAAKPLDKAWLTEQGLQAFIAGKLPVLSDIVDLDELVQFESRLGIGRNVKLATVESGLLYQTEHLRLAPEVGFAVQVSMPLAAAKALQDNIAVNPLQRFGGEGRMVEMAVREAKVTPLPSVKCASMLMLLTDMLPPEQAAAVPLPGFVKTNYEGLDCWEGEINGVALRVKSVVAGKARASGGWDIAANAPKPIQHYVPAGSCFFIEPIKEEASLAALQGACVGRNTLSGFGTLICVAG